MPTWLWWFLPVFLIHVIIAFIMSPPEAVARWFVAKFELHPQLDGEATTVMIHGNQVDDEEKKQLIFLFNTATFIDRYYQILPKYTGTPIVIVTQRGKTQVQFFVYVYDDHVDVFRQIKKKVVAYRLLSDHLQERSALSGQSLVQA